MARRLEALPLTQEAFAPFGRVLVRPALGRIDLIGELENARSSEHLESSCHFTYPCGVSCASQCPAMSMPIPVMAAHVVKEASAHRSRRLHIH